MTLLHNYFFSKLKHYSNTKAWNFFISPHSCIWISSWHKVGEYDMHETA